MFIFVFYLFTRFFFQCPIGLEIRTTVKIRWSFAQMCCAVSLVCPSIATHCTCQFWARSEPVSTPKNRVCGQMWSACCNSIPLFRTSDEECCPLVLTFLLTMLSRKLQLQQKRLLKLFRWEVFDHPPSPTRTWLPLIFISFFVWNGRRRTTFFHNELQISVENWLKAQAAGFYDDGIGKLVAGYEKCLRWSVDYVEK